MCLTDTETGNKLRLRVRARSAIEAAAKLDGALIGPGCAYVLRKVEPSAAGRQNDQECMGRGVRGRGPGKD